jgi:hypothetical protein
MLTITEALAAGLAAAATFSKEADKALCIEVSLQQAGYKIVRAPRTAEKGGR